MTNEELKKTTGYDEAMRAISEANEKLTLENKFLREKIHEYKMIYGIEQPTNTQEMFDWMDLIFESYRVMSEKKGATIGVMKKACVDIREYALRLLGVLCMMEQMKDETVDRLIKRQLKEDK